MKSSEIEKEAIMEAAIAEEQDYVYQALEERVTEKSKGPQPPSKPEYTFKAPKNVYLTRDEYLRIDSSIKCAERVNPTKKVSALHIETDANNAEHITLAYTPSINHSTHQQHDVGDTRTLNETNGEMDQYCYERLYGGGVLESKSTGPYKSRFDYDEYIPLNNLEFDKDAQMDHEWSIWGYKGYASKYHSKYFCEKVDQGILDFITSFDIAKEKGADELPAFSFPYLCQTTETETTSKIAVRDYDFVKIMVSYKNFQRNPGTKFPEYDYVIRIFRITNSKTSCTERYVHGDSDLAYEVAKKIYYKWENKDCYCAFYDLESVNELIKENIQPHNENLRFLPDGFYKDQAFIHDRESDSYIEMGEWKKAIHKKAKIAERQSKKIMKELENNKPVMDLIKQKAAELMQKKSNKETLDWLKSL